MSRSRGPDGGESGPAPSRRSVLKAGALGGAAAALGVAGRQAREASAQPAASLDFELSEVPVAALQADMETGRRSSRSITRLYLDRIAALDGRLHSILEVNPDALTIADELDRERAAGRVRGPLHGVPIVLKDNIETADRMTTTAGSLALEGAIAKRDAGVAAALRSAGAVLLAKANLSEWANFRSTRSSSGWSGRGGQCRNPYATTRSPCGSSSGSGAAASASLCAAAVGTETNGSIVCPSSANGLVGIKPTVGLLSRGGIVPISHSQDTAGPMARTVADAVALLDGLVGADERDSALSEPPGGAVGAYRRHLDPRGLSGARLGVARSFFGFHDQVDAVLEEALQAMKDAGAELIDPVDLESPEELQRPSYEVLLYEFKADLEAYLATLVAGLPRTLAEIIRFNERNREREMPWFGQEIFEQAVEKGSLDTPEYLEALAACRRLTRSEGIDRVVEQQRLDAIVAPTGGPAWTIDLVNGDHFGGGSSTPAAVAGYPNVTVPAGWVHGLPVGLSFFGSAWSEPKLIRIAYAFEQETRQRRPPRLLERVEV